MKKKIAALLITIVMLTTMATGCGNTEKFEKVAGILSGSDAVTAENEDVNVFSASEAEAEYAAADERAEAVSYRTMQYTFTKETEWGNNPWNNPVELRVSGGKGGSAERETGSGTANANAVMADLLLFLKKAGIRYCLASLQGGTAPEAVAASAEAVITVHEDDAQKMSEEISRFNENLKEEYASADPDLIIEELYPNLLVENVLQDRERDDILAFLANLPSGICTVSRNVYGSVRFYSNTGVVRIAEDGCSIVIQSGSTETYPAERMANAQAALAESLGFTVR